ncbi:MAG: endonuclease [Candidatus Firestonebacteria bacterium RIFOXYA2_FULL_40_8]|nr:MAG: endonuclease [Candidatus Firestonebacteria bacterium RIFOXYA2_FULL_40_8]
MQKSYYVYIATNNTKTVLYTGVTNNLIRRASEHREGKIEGFTKKYKVNKIIFYQEFNNIQEALSAEKRIKGWRREKKIELIKSKNQDFKDLIN